jgi:TolB-like protein/DNA-binding winged helix-turn-helix (wHTH) protein/tetratricopeptide (TPR) repeat protein
LPIPSTSQEVRFGEYSLDLRTGELRHNGVVLKLQLQPAKVLGILACRAGKVVTRQELADQVWGSETHVDFEHGLNYAIRQIRSVLEDHPEHPRFVETVPKRGYRFIAPLVSDDGREQMPPVGAANERPSRRPMLPTRFTAIVLIAVVAGLIWLYLRTRSEKRPRIESVAVLPLRNLSNDPQQEFFSDGMTDELITDLAKAGGLRVISHTSVEGYKNVKKPLPEIARELGVDAIVEGTIMRSADRVRITAQLIDARSDQHIWAESYERDLRDMFTLQDEVAKQIVNEIGTNLAPKVERQASSGHVIDPAVHEAYLRGNFYWNQLTCEGFTKARQYYEQATGQNPQFARAYLGLAESYFTLADWGCSPERELIAKSKAAALKALELDPSLGEAHAWLGKLAFFYEWNFPKAENELKQGIELSPNYPGGHIIYAVFLVCTGRRQLALAEMQKAHDLDPISQLPNIISVLVFYLARDYDAAIEQGKKTIDLYPSSWAAYIFLEDAYERRGLWDQAAATYIKMKELQGASPREMSALRMMYQKSGMRGLWQRELASAERNHVSDACWFAGIFAHLGDKDKALKFLAQASQQHCSGPHTTVADPVFDDFRSDARYRAIADGLRIQQ